MLWYGSNIPIQSKSTPTSTKNGTELKQNGRTGTLTETRDCRAPSILKHLPFFLIIKAPN